MRSPVRPQSLVRQWFWVLAAAMLVLPDVRAQTVTPPATFTAFSVQSGTDGVPGPETPALVLIADGGGQTVFSLPNLDGMLDVSSGGVPDYNEYWAMLGIVPRSGYVISGVELSGTLSGALQVGVPPRGTVDYPGAARNNAYFGFNTGTTGDHRFPDIDGTQAFSLSLDVVDAYPLTDGGLGVDIWGSVSADADYTYYSWVEDGVAYESKATSYASLAVTEARFTVYWEIAPVPEPHVWLMLAAGLLPLAAWRRQG